jgi:hypothetical protein
MRYQNSIPALAVGALLAGPFAATAADSQDIQEIRKEIQQMRDSYEQRIQALEKRLQEAEQSSSKAEAAATQAASSAAQSGSAAPSPTAPSANAFNPQASLILSGIYSNLSQDPAKYRLGGFVPGGEEVGPGKRGFSIAESELTLSANVDPYFYGQFTLSATPDDKVSVEEAFFNTTKLGSGLSIKGGRFFSALGYQNELHAHAWDFVDNPLASQAFLGKQYKQNGLQVRWIAPTDTFLELGAEAGNGSAFPGTERNRNGLNAGVAFAHLGGDVGASHSWRAGLSYLQTNAEDRAFTDIASATQAIDSFTGKSKLWIADAVWKWAPNGNPIYTNFKVQGEYFRRRETGTLGLIDLARGAYSSAQSGWYLQGVYQFESYWRVGLRYDKLNSGTTNIALVDSGLLPAGAFPSLAPYGPKRISLMLDYNPSEFSRIRLQVARDKSRPDAADNQVFLQYIYSLGAHGAHKF